MNARARVALFAILVVFGSCPQPACAQWLLNGTPVCSYPSLQSTPTAVPDGSGGAFVFWYDARSAWALYGQHLDAGGHILWSADGVSIASNVATNVTIFGVPDGQGGAILAYSASGGTHGVYVQRINSAGTKLWGSGVLIDSQGTFDYTQAMISDLRSQAVAGSSPGVIIAYEDNHLQGNGTVYVQDIDNTGTTRWTAGGVPLDTTSNAYAQNVAMITDGHPGPTQTSPRGAILAWVRSTNTGSHRICAQRFLYNGAPQWGTNGTPVCSAISSQFTPCLAFLYSGNAVVEWEDTRDPTPDIYAQRLPLGIWDPIGILISHKGALYPAISGDNAGGAISLWSYTNPATSESDLYAQRIDGNGIVRWQGDGIPLCTQPKSQDTPRIVSDGATGAIMLWRDLRSGTNYDIYAQHVDSLGVRTWDPNDQPVCVATGNQYPWSVISDGNGGAIAAWDDPRYGSGTSYVLAQHVASDGGLVAAQSEPPVTLRVLPAFPNPASRPTTFRYVLPTAARVSADIYDVEGRLVRDLIDEQEEPAGTHTIHWDGRATNGARLPSGVYLFEVREGKETASERVLLLTK